VLLGSAAPIGFAIWIFTMPAERRDKAFASIPKGVGTRAAAAGISLAALLVLTLVVLPATKRAGDALLRLYHGFGRQPRGKRLAMLPLEALTWIAWFLLQALFALDTIAVLAAGAAMVLYAARILDPNLFSWLPG
jgi:hypothetical protein